MRSKLATYALAGTLGLAGVAAAALVAPAVSFAATGDSTALDERVASIKDALKGLVSDGSLTQTQADEVAETLADAPLGPRGHGGPDGSGPGFGGPGFGGPGRHGGPDLAAVTEALGITADELRAAAEDGSTLRELAQQQGVSPGALVDKLVAAAKTRLADAVADGRLTQAQADQRAADIKARVTDSLDEPVRFGHHGHHFWHGPDTDDDGAPSQTPSTAPQSDDA